MAEEWKHAWLRAYLRGEGGKGQREKGKEVSREDGFFAGSVENEELNRETAVKKTLQELIDQIREGVQIPDLGEDLRIPRYFDEIDDLLTKIIGGDPSEQDKKIFLSALFHSELFYQRVVLRLKQIEPDVDESSVSLLSNIHVQSDEQILAGLDLFRESSDAIKTVPEMQELFGIWQKVKAYLSSLSTGQKRWAYAAASITILIILSFFGVRFYNTTFQLMQAEALLKNHYLVYMDGVPRLTGGYKTTGNSQTMDTPQEKSYLRQAAAKITKAQAYIPESPRLAMLQARVSFLSGDILKAEKEYRHLLDENDKPATVLNDLGVIEYEKGDFKQADRYFLQAIEKNRRLSEAYYNLALAEQKLGLFDKAMETMNKMLAIERDEGWQEAGQSFLIKINLRTAKRNNDTMIE